MKTELSVFEIQDGGFLENSPKWPNTSQYGYFMNRDDAERPEIDLRRYFVIQDGTFRFLKDSLKWQNSTQHGYFRNRDNVQRPEIDSRRHLKFKMATSRFWKTDQNGHIPPNMGISRTGMMTRGWKLTPDAILKSKMEISGF